jgi:hypothetical protein
LTEGEAEVVVQFIKEWGGRIAGQHYLGLAQIGIGDSQCGEWVPYTAQTVYEIALHELGHALGFGHSNDSTNIMYESTVLAYQFEREYREQLAGNYFRFYGVCTASENGTFAFDVEATAPIDVYLVADREQLSLIAAGKEFHHYAGCEGADMTHYERTCTISADGGIIIQTGDVVTNVTTSIVSS